MYSFFGMMTAALFIGWAQDSADRQQAGSWHRAPLLTLFH